MAVSGYVPVSTERQAGDGESLGTQQSVIEGYAMMQGLPFAKRLRSRNAALDKNGVGPKAPVCWPT